MEVEVEVCVVTLNCLVTLPPNDINNNNSSGSGNKCAIKQADGDNNNNRSNSLGTVSLSDRHCSKLYCYLFRAFRALTNFSALQSRFLSLSIRRPLGMS